MALGIVPSVLVRSLNKMDRISRLLNRIDKIEQDRHDNPPPAGEVLWAQLFNYFVASLGDGCPSDACPFGGLCMSE